MIVDFSTNVVTFFYSLFGIIISTNLIYVSIKKSIQIFKTN